MRYKRISKVNFYLNVIFTRKVFRSRITKSCATISYNFLGFKSKDNTAICHLSSPYWQKYQPRHQIQHLSLLSFPNWNISRKIIPDFIRTRITSLNKQIDSKLARCIWTQLILSRVCARERENDRNEIACRWFGQDIGEWRARFVAASRIFLISSSTSRPGGSVLVAR